MERLEALWRDLTARTSQSAPLRYAMAATAALVLLAFRAVFDPALGPGAYYFLYFPGIVVVAYALGFRPAVLAIVVAGFTSYLVFSRAGIGLKADMQANLRLALFVGAALGAAFFVARVRARLSALEAGVSEATARSRSEADLFREFAERVSGHLQLLAALLQLKSRDEPEPDYARVLMNAASRTMLISRMHRSLVDTGDGRVDFAAFAQRLADSALQAHGHPPLVITVEGELVLAPEQAVSLALILLERVNARARDATPGHLVIGFSKEGDEAVLVIAEDRPPAGADVADGRLTAALVAQMGGRLVFGRGDARAQMRLVFPTVPPPLPVWDPLQPLH